MRIELTISAPVLERFPELVVYSLRVQNLYAALSGQDTTEALRTAVAQCNVPPDSIATHEIVSAWRGAYGAMGLKPSKFRSSIEALLRRAVKRSDMALLVPAVNIYNACSIAGLSPMGAFDVSRMPGKDLVLRMAQPGVDTFNPLGAEPSAFPINRELVVYAVADEVLCWAINCRDSQTTALTEMTDEGIFFSEAIKIDHRSYAEGAMNALKDTMASFGAGCGDVIRADSFQPTLVI